MIPVAQYTNSAEMLAAYQARRRKLYPVAHPKPQLVLVESEPQIELEPRQVNPKPKPKPRRHAPLRAILTKAEGRKRWQRFPIWTGNGQFNEPFALDLLAKMQAELAALAFSETMTFRSIVRLCCEFSPFNLDGVLGSCRAADIALFRHLVIYIVRQSNPEFYSLPQLGRRFNRDHTTILNSLRRVEVMLDRRSTLSE